MKTCTKCLQEKELSCFYYQKRDGSYYSHCKSCRADASKLYRQGCKNRIKDYQLRYYKENKEFISSRSAEYRTANKEKISQINKKYRALNNEKHREYCNKRYAEDPSFSIAVRLRKRIYAAVKNKTNTTLELVGCDIGFLVKHLESKFQPGMSWLNRSEWHIDHIVPLASFNLTDPEQLKKACHYTNLQPLWAADNIRKRDKLPEDLQQ